ncbi:hypothetical protein PENSPDRAFT_660610 [Peniophora sp. CONT]|nr:hypothetical protein PENSPDRAFT_660610 [Peniophora sp. CONT]
MSPVNPATLIDTAIDALHVLPAHQVQTVQSQPSSVPDARLHATNPRASDLGDGLHSRFGYAVYKLSPRGTPEASRSAAFAALGILLGFLAIASAAGLAFFLRRRHHRRALHRRRRAHRITIDPLPTPTPFMRKAPPHPLDLSASIRPDVPSSPTMTNSTTSKLPFPSSRPSTPGSGGLARFLHGVHGSISSIGFGPSRDSDEERVIDIVSRADTPVSARLPLMDFNPSPRSAAPTLSRAPSAASTFGGMSAMEVSVPLDLIDASRGGAFIDIGAEERDLTMMSPLSPSVPQSAASTGTWISSVTSDLSPRTPFSAVSSKFQGGYDGTGTFGSFGSGTYVSTRSGKSTATSNTTYTSPTPYVPPRPPLHNAASFDSITASSTKSSTSPPRRPRRRDTKEFLRARDMEDELLQMALKREARRNRKQVKAESEGENANPFLDPVASGHSLPPAYSPPHADSPLRSMFDSPIERLHAGGADLKLAPSLSSASLRSSSSTASTSTRLPTRSSSLMVPGSSRGMAASGSRTLASHPSTRSLASSMYSQNDSVYSHTRSDSTRSNGRPLPLPPGSF